MLRAPPQKGVTLLKVFDHPFGVVLANGLETFLTANAEGWIIGHEPLSHTPLTPGILAPLRFCHLAKWSSQARVGIGLTRNGEILVFSDGALVFAKRRGAWQYFTHGEVLRRMTLGNQFTSELCRAVYETCLAAR